VDSDSGVKHGAAQSELLNLATRPKDALQDQEMSRYSCPTFSGLWGPAFLRL